MSQTTAKVTAPHGSYTIGTVVTNETKQGFTIVYSGTGKPLKDDIAARVAKFLQGELA